MSFEDYLLYRIALLEDLVRNHAEDKSKLQGFRYGIVELKLALKELRKPKKEAATRSRSKRR